jgi:aarF domain-containing kinase
MLMQRDFVLMRRAALICSKLPFLKELRLEESVRQFGGPLKEQLDLSTEARALARFNSNFKYWGNVGFPAPVYPLVAEDVLVETFEPGRLISRSPPPPHTSYGGISR